jgi:aminocarboxymuconate-semialdehyde decarboxylase
MRIDVHNHAIPERAISLLRADPAYRTTIEGDRVRGGNHVSFTLFPSFRDPDVKLAELESKRLEAAVISAAPPLFFYDVDERAGEAIAVAVNEGLREFAAAHPDRYRWMAHVPMGAPARAPHVLEDAVRAGAAGVEIASNVAGARLDDQRFEPFWSAAERLGTPVLIHPAYNERHRGLDDYYLQNVIGNLLETTIAVERLVCAGVLDHHPRLRLVLAHGGGYYPFQAGRLRHARTVRPELRSAPGDPWSYFGQIAVDVITHDRDALAYLVARCGAENVVMGTDLPFDMATPSPMDALEAAAGEQAARTIAEDNPTRLYRFGH